ncbi:MAG: hypothetical protein RQ866_07770 [Bacteroidales bacterium]|nr:hypothetical protein [Bacteroidales bacterium]
MHLRWDVNEDGEVDIPDIIVIGQKQGMTIVVPYPRWEVNQDGVANVQDLTLPGYYFDETVA